MSEMVASEARRVEAIVDRYGLSGRANGQLLALVEMLADDPRAPTAVRNRSRAIDDHLADSLVALEVVAVRAAERVADLGSGAGLPGLPLAIALASATFSLVESAARKCEFLARAAGACGVSNARVVHARAEAWPEGIESFDVVTARALAPLPIVLEYAAPLLKEGGTAVVWRGRRDSEAEAAGERAARELGLVTIEVRRVQPYAAAENRHLHLISKVRETPEGFPRRPGMAAKRPIGSR